MTDYANGYAKITHVAIEYEGKMYSLPAPNRHHHVIHMIALENGVGLRGENCQGFLDANGNFLSRKGAYIRAIKTDQLKRRTGPGMYDGDELFSEDLW